VFVNYSITGVIMGDNVRLQYTLLEGKHMNLGTEASIRWQFQLAVRGIMPFGNYRGDLRNRELCRED